MHVTPNKENSVTQIEANVAIWEVDVKTAQKELLAKDNFDWSANHKWARIRPFMSLGEDTIVTWTK